MLSAAGCQHLLSTISVHQRYDSFSLITIKSLTRNYLIIIRFLFKGSGKVTDAHCKQQVMKDRKVLTTKSCNREKTLMTIHHAGQDFKFI